MEIRRLIRKLVRRTGFQRAVAPSFVDVMHAQQIDVVLDVGANDGGFGREIRDAGYRGRIVSFEPNPEAFARLEQNAAHDPLWDVFQLGVGDAPGELQLSVSRNDLLSSFKEYAIAEDPGGEVEYRVTAKVVRLDQFLADHPEYLSRTYLKVDTQGYEMEVIRGAGDFFNRLLAVQAELGLIQFYKLQHDWLEVALWMQDRGFEVATLSCNSASRDKSYVRELDVVFCPMGSRRGSY